MECHTGSDRNGKANTNRKTGFGRLFAEKGGKRLYSKTTRAAPQLPQRSQVDQEERAPRLPPRPGASASFFSSPAVVAKEVADDERQLSQRCRLRAVTHGPGLTGESLDHGLSNRLSFQLDDLITAMDFGHYSDERDNVNTQRHSIARPDFAFTAPSHENVRSLPPNHDIERLSRPRQIIFSSYFDKVNHYANSRLPPVLPPLKLYMPTYPLLCLAAQHSLAVYSSDQIIHPFASSSSTTLNFPASSRLGTKAMTISVTSLDTSDTIVLAIRGSASFTDWSVNFRPAPVSPIGFLDDEGNACHGGFLEVAKSMVEPIASRLLDLLARRASRSPESEVSLMLTGHSAGGAVASLLYAHMLSTSPSVSSSLKVVAQTCKRMHCVVFGAPPLTLLPLQRPTASHSVPSQSPRASTRPHSRKNLFFSFINEGDPVTRAEVAYMKNLLVLMTNPKPEPGPNGRLPVWPVPQAALSCAGRLILLRRSHCTPSAAVKVKGKGILKASSVQVDEVHSRGMATGQLPSTNLPEPREKVEACMITDEDLRGVVFGDPLMHSMRLYAQRIEALAVGAVTGGIHIS